MSRHRRIEDLVGGPPSQPGGVFGPTDDNVIPGQVVFALHAEAAAGVTVSIPGAPLRLPGEESSAVTRLGPSAVDNVLSRLNVKSITQVHGATPPDVVEGRAIANDLGLDGIYHVRYAAASKPEAVAERLGRLDEVAWAEPARYREACVVPNDPMYAQQWGLARINCPDAWDRTTGSTSVTVAVVDTGVDLNHPELAPLLVAGQDLVNWAPGSVPKSGWVFEGDFMGVDSDPQDEVGHGTHVAGTIACVSNNATGVAGVTWRTRLMPVRVLARIRETATGRISGTGSSVDIAAGIRWATDHGAQIINMSLGGYGDAQVEREAVAYAISRGVVVVAAMGNDNTDQPHYPSAYPDVVAVGATDASDRRASFSNRGNWIDVAAPGVQIQSTYWDDTYASLSGTSMATPHVAGVAALILAIAPTTTPAQVANILRNTAKPLRDTPTDAVPNDRYGHGLVQAAAAVNMAAPPKPSVVALCPSVTVICQSRICPSTPVVCPKSRVLICQSQLLTCHPSIPCPSSPINCPVHSVAAACPSLVCPSVVCGGGGPPVEQAAEFETYDPHGYDPYGGDYT